jgi:hypothetical protein
VSKQTEYWILLLLYAFGIPALFFVMLQAVIFEHHEFWVPGTLPEVIFTALFVLSCFPALVAGNVATSLFESLGLYVGIDLLASVITIVVMASIQFLTTVGIWKVFKRVRFWELI